MFEKLQLAQTRYRTIEAQLADPSVVADPTRLAALQKEYKQLTPIFEALTALQQAQRDEKEALEILDGNPEEDLRALATEELHTAKERQQLLENALRTLLLPRDPRDEKNVVVEIRACAGGEEAALFAAELYRMYTMYAATQSFRVSVLSENETGLGGYREITFLCEGEGAYSRFKFESGVHRVQRIPLTESNGKIQTSTVSVAVLPEAREVDVQIDPRDITFESIKSSGAGGQHINKTESAVRLTHKPSGIVIVCQEERSQYSNKDKALQLLRTKLYNIRQSAQDNAIASERRQQVGTGDRSERIRTYNFPQSRVTDHRIALTLHSLTAFLNGEIGDMISALRSADAAGKLVDP